MTQRHHYVSKFNGIHSWSHSLRSVKTIKRFSAQWTTKATKWEKPNNDNSFNWYQMHRSACCQANTEVNWESKFEKTDKWSPFIHVNEFIIWINIYLATFWIMQATASDRETLAYSIAWRDKNRFGSASSNKVHMNFWIRYQRQYWTSAIVWRERCLLQTQI